MIVFVDDVLQNCSRVKPFTGTHHTAVRVVTLYFTVLILYAPHMHMHTGAVNVNIVGILKKRFATGKIGLADLVTSDEGKEKFKVSD